MQIRSQRTTGSPAGQNNAVQGDDLRRIEKETEGVRRFSHTRNITPQTSGHENGARKHVQKNESAQDKCAQEWDRSVLTAIHLYILQNIVADQKLKLETGNETCTSIEPTSKEKIQNHKRKALLETGPYTVQTTKIGTLVKPMKGFAGRTESSLGEVEVSMTINDETLRRQVIPSLRRQVIPNGLMTYRIVVGRNLLEQVTVLIKDGAPVLTKNMVSSSEMVIQVDKEEKPSTLTSVMEIADDHKKAAVAELVDNYAPAKIASSARQHSSVPTSTMIISNGT